MKLVAANGRNGGLYTQTIVKRTLPMSGKEAERIEENTVAGAADAGTAVSGIAAEISNQLHDFENGKKILVNDRISGTLDGLQNISFGLSDKEREKAFAQLGEGLQNMVTGDLTNLRDMMKKNGLDTKEVDAKIKVGNEQVEAVKPLHQAILKGDLKAVQKLVGEMKPEQLEKYAELLQKHFDRSGLGIELDTVNGQLVVSRSHGDRAVAIGKDKCDVIGINADGSYDFNRHYRHENSAKELSGMMDSAVSNFMYPKYRQYDNYKSVIGHDHAIRIGQTLDSVNNNIRHYGK